MIPFLLRDILHYSDKEVKNLSLEEYVYAVQYAQETYIRRDVGFIMSKIYGKKDKGNDKTLNISVPQTDIENWVKQQYENARDNTRVGE